jgi:uncharacterized membrane protein
MEEDMMMLVWVVRLKPVYAFAIFGLPCILLSLVPIELMTNPFVRFFLLISYFGLSLGWLWITATALKKLGGNTNRNGGKLFFLEMLIIIAILLILTFFASFRPSVVSNQMSDVPLVILLLVVCVILTLIVHCTVYFARRMTSIEQGHPTLFHEYLGTMLLFWLFPIGVYFLQKRILPILQEQVVRSDFS